MSINLHLRVIYYGKEEKIDLIQTPTIVTDELMRADSWQNILKAYLNWVKTTDYTRSHYSKEKKRLGLLWREVDNSQGRMIFEAW